MTIIKINGGFWGWEPIETLERLYPLFEQYTLDPIYEWYGNFVNRKPEWQRSEERQAYQGCTVISGRFLHYGNFFYIVTDEEELIQRFERLVADNKATQAYQDERKVCFPCSECNQWSAASGLCGLTGRYRQPQWECFARYVLPKGKDKTEDDRFFVLTLIAIAEEITARGIGEKEQQHIQLAVGLPPAHFGSQAEKFTAYFQGRGLVEFMYGDKHYTISIEDVACYPQAYAAAATMLHALLDDPKAVVLDIGGFTADYLLLKNGKADLASCDSLENGVILLYNKIRSRGNAELDLLLDEGDVDAILMGRRTQYPAEAIQLVERLAQEFVNDLFSTLRERMLDLRYCKVVFVGGGAILLRRQIEDSGKVGTPLFVTNINANAAGFEYLYRLETVGR